MAKEMDTYFAVFNGHVGNAHKRAQRAFNRHFGPGAWRAHMSGHVRRGVMSIFEENANPYTKWYAEKVQELVNAHLRKEGTTNGE